MGSNAGDTIIAPGADSIQTLYIASSANVDITTTEVDVTGATITFSTVRANARFVAIGSFYMSMLTANGGVASGKLNVDGVNQAGFANYTGLNTTPDRANVAQTWIGTLAATGSHTIKLRAVGSAAVAAQRVNATSTTLTIIVFQ